MVIRFPALLTVLLLSGLASGQSYPPLPALTIPASFMAHLPRTAGLLSVGTTRPPHQLRVLVYGQSISMQDWWKQVKTYLEQRYPEVPLVMENRAIGGFSSERLKQMVANDVVPFCPDLILFHDYGNEPDYEAIIRLIRSRTTAEIAIQTDHIGVGQNQEWHDRHSEVWLPDLCQRYGLALLDVRAAWKAYIQQHRLSPAHLLSDHVHLNDHGNDLMAQLITRYLEALPRRGTDPTTGIRVLRRGTDFSPRRGRVNLPVAGNRIDLVWSNTGDPADSVSVTIDGQRPSAQVASYHYTRPALDTVGFFLNRIGQVLSLQLGGHPQTETWTLTITAVDSVRQQVGFSLRGSTTGEDGTGSSDRPFTSRSGRIRIDSTDWFRRRHAGDFGQFPWLRPGDQLQWQVRSTGRDSCPVRPGELTTIVQGVPPVDRLLVLRGKGVRALREVRVYQPPLRP